MTFDPRFGTETTIKLLGGQLTFRQTGRSFGYWREKIDGMKKRAMNLQPVFVTIRPLLQARSQMAFESEGPGWAPLSPAYAAWKATNFPGKTILRRTDRLYDSLVLSTSDSIWAATPRTVRYGSKVPYYRWHQTGASNMPARPVVMMTRDTSRAITRRVSTYVIEGRTNG